MGSFRRVDGLTRAHRSDRLIIQPSSARGERSSEGNAEAEFAAVYQITQNHGSVPRHRSDSTSEASHVCLPAGSLPGRVGHCLSQGVDRWHATLPPAIWRSTCAGLVGTRCWMLARSAELGWRIINDDDAEARQRMIQCNLRLVVAECRRHVGRGVPMMDLIAEGNVGLIRAVAGFDPAMGARFSTYAMAWIRRMIQLAVLDARSLIRIPPKRVIDDDDVNGVPTIVRVRGVGLRGEVGADPLDWMVAPDSADDQMADRRDIVGRLLQALDQIDDADGRQAEVLRLRLGLLGREPMSYRRIGQRLGISHECARQLGQRGLECLRAELSA